MQIFHDRARDAGIELRKLIVSLSTGILAIYFLAVTREIKPPLEKSHKTILLVSIILFAICVLSGIIAWFSDGKRYYYWAKLIDSSDDAKKQKAKTIRNRWGIIRLITDIALFAAFFLGILFSSIFLFQRINF